ncbi:MAG: cyanophycinase [Planctomycetes bacterium]|nr:cyanophycinase [Planctomycetota bacterium]
MSPRACSAAAVGAAVLGAAVGAVGLLPATAQERRVADEPARPKELVSFLTGDPDDLEVAPAGPALLLMGGGRDVDHAFAWFRDQARGGDIVVLRTSGADGYNAYLYQQIGGVDSVETLLVTTRALADSPWVARRIEEAEGVFIAGGDQATYVRAWKGTALERALHAAWRRGAALGGTSAGAAILGQFSYAALHGSLTSGAALRDPFTRDLTLEREFLRLSFLEGAVVDTHFGRRDREGRLLAFLARLMADGWHERPLGIGLDEETALAIGRGGKARVFGKGAVTLYRPHGPPAVCEPGRALRLEGVGAWTLRRNDTLDLPAGPGGPPPRRVAAADGAVR